jgi:hypothetical protein
MKTFRTAVIAVLLAIWSFPAVSLAAPAPSPPAATQPTSPAPGTERRATETSEAEQLAEREKQSPDLQDFRGGGVSIYLGSGAAIILLVILLILIL